ncbi:hypothetical protein [Bdellovibrio sp. NC01]|uniref:hypothetical protein n=1 Tax=Bdellovibrio sp. NC01 TaxID=2220073 RepID=UPI00115B073E|nr:hypothetical protein [Bdellovibrio sp. NC01]QDK37146.1 hypothetical protein DOE51_05845 [Bdellovibrio sp. NC01]
MKNSILCATVLVAAMGLISCSNYSTGNGTGSGDFSSLTLSTTYHNESFDSYQRVFLKDDHTFTQYEVQTINGVQKECSITGTWDLISGEDSPSTGNLLKVTNAQFNGAGSSTNELDYPVSEVSNETLKLQFSDQETAVDLTSTDLANYPNFQNLTPGSLPTDTFCNR